MFAIACNMVHIVQVDWITTNMNEWMNEYIYIYILLSAKWLVEFWFVYLFIYLFMIRIISSFFPLSLSLSHTHFHSITESMKEQEFISIKRVSEWVVRESVHHIITSIICRIRKKKQTDRQTKIDKLTGFYSFFSGLYRFLNLSNLLYI